MRIAINALSVQGGGGQTFLKNLLQHLLRSDRENEYLLLITQAKTEALGLENRYPNLRTLICPPCGWIARALWEQLSMPWVLRRMGVDVLYAPGNQGPVLSPFPYVVLIQSVDPLLVNQRMPFRLRMKMKALRALTAASVQYARKVIAISHYTRRLLVSEFGCHPEKIVVIPHGSPSNVALPSKVAQEREIEKLAESSQYFLAVSDIRYNKNYETLIAALATVCRRIPERVNLLIAGEPEDHRYVLRLKDIAQQGGVGSRVFFLGSLDHATLRWLYAGARALIFPSRLESFGLPPLEAMAYGVPVAASRIDAVLEVCGDAVLYFDPDSSGELADVMVRLLEDDGLRKDLVARGRLRAQQFSWGETARRTLDVLRVAVCHDDMGLKC